MFSSLGPLFRAHFKEGDVRQTEQLDTRMAIRRDEKQEHGRKRDPREDQPASSDLWEDSTSVSIESLRAFLINFVSGQIKTQVGAQTGDRVAEEQQQPPQPEHREPQNTRTARALGAYQSMAERNGSAYHPPLPATSASDVDLVGGGDVRIIHQLIEDLADLSAKGQQTLVIERADSFLHALSAAVDKAKSIV